MDRSRPKTIALGGGIAGLEAVMALADLASERTQLTLVAPTGLPPEAEVVEQPFLRASRAT
jgi:hypothetical protein